MTVVASPAAKLRVPAKTLVRIAPPSKGPGELRCGPAVETIRVGRAEISAAPGCAECPQAASLSTLRRPGDGGAEFDNRHDHNKYEQKGPQRSGHPQPFEGVQGRLDQ